MAVLTSAYFIFILYCTEWFGIRHCYTLPVPTLLNYYHSSPKNNWDWKFKHMRNPSTYYDKFVFPTKDEIETAERIGTSQQKETDAGKIFFPDEVADSPSKDQEKSYQFVDTDTFPVWQIRHRNNYPDRPMSGVLETSRSKLPSIQFQPNTITSGKPFTDGSRPNQSSQQQLSVTSAPTMISSSPSPSSSISPMRRKQLEKQKEREAAVASTVREWFDWYKEQRKSNSPELKKPTANVETGEELERWREQGDTSISDQSLVAAFQNQKCPEGQVRLSNGECKVKVEI